MKERFRIQFDVVPCISWTRGKIQEQTVTVSIWALIRNWSVFLYRIRLGCLGDVLLEGGR